MKTLERHYEKLRGWRLIQDAEAIDVTGAAKWYWEGSDQEQWDLYHDFPAITPPFECTWLEYGDIKTVRSEGKVSQLPVVGWRMAAAIYTSRVPEELGAQVLETDALRMMTALILTGSPRITGETNPHYSRALRDAAQAGKRAKWGIVIVLYAEDHVVHGKGLHRFGASYFYLDERGMPIEAPTVPASPLGDLMKTPMARTHGQEWVSNWIIHNLYPFFFALSLMNAKNVSLVEQPLPEKVAKRREREGKAAIKFKVLRIEPMKARTKAEAAPGESHLKLAMHLCRGHFKDYREGGGLFGKYKGLYWWDSQVRGTDEAGRIIKDYSLGGPA